MFAKIRKITGEMKPYEKRAFVMLSVTSTTNVFSVLLSLVVNYTPDYRCDVTTIMPNITNASKAGILEKEFIRYLTPDDTTYDSCKIYNRSFDDFLIFRESNESVSSNTSADVVSCDSFKFDLLTGESSAVTEMQLVCEKSWAKKLGVTLYFAGKLVGGLIGGFLSDKYGRRLIFISFTMLQFITTFLVGLSYDPFLYVTFSFINGFSSFVNYLAALLLAFETVQKRHRNFFYFQMLLWFSVGYMMYPGMAYFIRSWHWFCWMQIFFCLLYLPYFWILDESATWLLTVGKVKRAESVMRKIAKCNNEEFDEKDLIKLKNATNADSSSLTKAWSVLCRQPILVARLLVMSSCWLTCNLLYFSIALNTNALSGDRFLNCFIAGVTEVVGNSLAFLVVEKLDRKKSFVVFGVIAAVANLAAPFVFSVNADVCIFITMFAKLATSVIFYDVYMVTPEIFPTAVRHSVTSVASGIGRAGAMLVPLLIYDANAKISSSVMSGLLFLTVLAYWVTIPNSHNADLPSTIHDAVNMKRKRDDDVIKEEMAERNNDEDVKETLVKTTI